MPAQKLKKFLDENGVKYLSITHSKAYTAQEIAAMSHISGNVMAKTVMVKIEGQMVMAVLPASYHVDIESLQHLFETQHVSIASEPEFMNRFPDCEIGAMPPFGNLYDLDVYLAASISHEKEMVFNAGTHSELIRMDYADFKRLVNPRVFKFSEKTISFPNDPRDRWDTD